jgi:hypothetical protein
MRRLILTASAAALAWCAALSPSLAQQRQNIGLVCTSDNTPADNQIEPCTKILALKVFSGKKLADIHFRRAVGWNRKGDYIKVIMDLTEAIKHNPNAVGLYNLRGSAFYDKSEYAIADFNDAIRLGGPHATILHNRANAEARNSGSEIQGTIGVRVSSVRLRTNVSEGRISYRRNSPT